MRRRWTEYVMLALLLASWAHGAEPQRPARLRTGWVSYYAAGYHVPVEPVEAIIEVESSWALTQCRPKAPWG